MANKCSLKFANTRNSRCKMDWSAVQKVVLIPIGARFTGLDPNSTVETFDEWLDRNIQLADPMYRFYPLPISSSLTDNSTEDTTWSDDAGNTYPMMDGKPALQQAYQHDYCLSKRLSAFNDNISRRALLIDKSGFAWGARKTDGFTGFEVIVKTSNPGFDTFSERKQPTISYMFQKVGEFNNEKDYETLEMNIEECEGLENVYIKIMKNQTTYDVKIFAECGNEDITANYSTLLTTKKAWKTGADLSHLAIVASDPTYSSVNNCFTFQVTDLTTNNLFIMSDPAQLALLLNPVLGIECPEAVVVT
jgi:hypothetical protein